MKKIVSFLLCIIITAPLIACDFEKEQNNTDENILKENNIAMQMYESAIGNEICVFDEHLGEINLKDLRFQKSNARLDECKLLKKAISDIDRDGINEYIIQSPDQEYIILRHHNSKVYSYCLDSCDHYKFNTDGTFYWCNSPKSSETECGLNKIIFDGETLKINSVYSLEYFTNPTRYEYYVGGKAVTENEYYAYRNGNLHKEQIKFSQFELTCSYPITAEQAWGLANAYWDNQDGCTEGAAGTTFIAKVALTDTPNSESKYYRAAFQVESYSGGGLEGYECMPPHTIREIDQILINAFTGEITTAAHESGGVGR